MTTPSSASKHHKVIILGAGLNGLAAAKTYLDIDPSVDLLVVDGDSDIGGVWSKSRIYPGLTFEQSTPMVNFTDMTMKDELRLEDWSDISGEQVNDFLIRYATKFDVIRRCKLNTIVESIERNGSGWKILVRPTGESVSVLESMTCEKLIIATGITSKPNLPSTDMSSFDGVSFHAKDMGHRHQELLADQVKHVTIIGGHKSALEAVGTYSQVGKNVEWLIKEEGGGPTWLMPCKDPQGNSTGKMATVKAMSFLSTSVYHSDRWLNRFLQSQRWWLGTYIITKAWAAVTKMIQMDTYSKSENGKRLKPVPDSMYWFVPGGTVLHDRDLETLRLLDEEKLIHVSRAHIKSAKGRSITLSNNVTVETDAVVFCTGWQLAFPTLFSSTLSYELGLPCDPSVVPQKEEAYLKSLDSASEMRIETLYPLLKHPPKNIHIPKSTLTPFRLFRFIAPPKLAAKGDNSIVFLGNWANGRPLVTAEIASLWSVAYLEGLMPDHTKSLLTQPDAMDRDIAHIEAYRRKRYLNALPFRISIFESGEFEEQLMKDLGLRPDRKAMKIPTGLKGWFGWKAWKSEWFDPYFASDYKGLVQEFLQNVEERGGGDAEVRRKI